MSKPINVKDIKKVIEFLDHSSIDEIRAIDDQHVQKYFQVYPIRKKAKLHDDFRYKANEFIGQPIICYYHCILIIKIRRNIELKKNLSNFYTLWDRYASLLLNNLSLRWLISACDTLTDYPRSTDERLHAQMASLLITTIKLSESERLFAKGSTLKHTSKKFATQQIFDGLISFNYRNDDTVKNLLNRLQEKTYSFQHISAKIFDEVLLRVIASNTVYGRLRGCNLKPGHTGMIAPKHIVVIQCGHTCNNEPHPKTNDFFQTALSAYAHQAITVIELNLYQLTIDQLDNTLPNSDRVIFNLDGKEEINESTLKLLQATSDYYSSLGTPCYLINFSLTRLIPNMSNVLNHFQHIWVTNSNTSQMLFTQGIPHSICPNLIMMLPIKKPRYKRNTIALVGINSSEQYQFAAQCSRWKRFKHLSGKSIRSSVSRHKFLITNDFYASCYALLANTSFHCPTQRQQGIKSLIKDIGLNPKRTRPNIESIQLLPFSAEEQKAILVYKQRSTDAFNRMIFLITQGKGSH